MVGCILIGIPTPLIATQLLWINLLTDTLPAVALGMDPGDPDVMKEKPRDPKESFFAKGAGLRVIGGGAMIGLLTILAFWLGYHQHGFNPYDDSVPANVEQYARSMAFMTIVAAQLFYSLSFRHPSKSVFTVGLFANKYLIGAVVVGFLLQFIVIGIPALSAAFKVHLLNAQGWMIVVGLGMVPFVASEIVKWMGRTFRKK
jgi:Ca2+-transporting ATPase